MTFKDDMGPDDGGDDIVAAEYVLGVMTHQERRQATLRIEAEPAFARLVDRWEAHFAALAAGYTDVEAPAGVKPAVDSRLFSDRASIAEQGGGRRGLLASLTFWRGLAAAAIAAFAVLIALPFLGPPTEAPKERLVASLAADGGDVQYLALYDTATHEIGLSHVTGERSAEHDFELWVIEGEEPPASLGIIPVGASVELPVTVVLRDKLSSGAVLAISVEPLGGSPTGQPTGSVVATGGLRAI
jgi:anti-sigma-K factor RskA